MFLKSIKLTNFRNYSNLDFKFTPAKSGLKSTVTILKGDNAQGKTNFLEGIYYLAAAKSYKGVEDLELIKYGEEFLRVEGVLEDSVSLEVVLQKQNNHQGGIKKRVKVNGIPRRTMDYAAHLVVVQFAPEDINLVTGSPSLRRNHVDQVLSQTDKTYKKTLINYENIVTQKNKLLKKIQEGNANVDELTFWSDEQIFLGSQLYEKRKKFFAFLNESERKFGPFKYEYKENEITKERLLEYNLKEVAAAASLIGPHRDDFIFLLAGKELSKFGSRGEQRTSVLDLKFAEVLYIEEVLGDRPILLLDDIFSELDDIHRKHVKDISNLQQTIITTVEWDAYLKKAFSDAKILTVEDGRISEKADK